MTVVVVLELFPLLLAAVVGLSVGRVAPRLVVPVALLGSGIALATAAVVAVDNTRGVPVADFGRYAEVRGAGIPFGLDLRLDGLSALVAVAVTLVAFLVQVYSVAYLRGDQRYPSYAAVVSLFTAAMLLVVMG